MKTLKLLPILMLAVFLVSTVSAFGAIYGEWENGESSISITEGESADFAVDIFSMDAPMTINIKLYDSDSNLVYAFEDDTSMSTPCTENGVPISGTACYAGDYTTDSNIYGTSGNYNVIITYSDDEDYHTSLTLSLTVNAITDTTAPVITLLGDNPITLTLGTDYTEYGATALDDVDGDITGSIVITNPVNVYVLGTYTVRYNVQDSAGNSAVEVTRTVNVISGETPDTIAPVITLLGDNPASVALGDTYTDAGATAEDDVDGDITANIVVTGSVDTSIVGIYNLAYNVQDAAGNSADEVTRIVNVYNPSDTTAPTITVITPEEDEEYDDSELTFEVEINEVAEVQFSLDESHRVTMDYQGMTGGILTFTYDVEVADGEHEVTFYATDAAGNEASRTVEFSVNIKEGKDNDKDEVGKTTTIGEDSFSEEAYLSQFKSKGVIYLEDEPTSEHLNWWQKFIAWLKRIFGFD